MAKGKGGKGGGSTNDSRKNGKANKQHPRSNVSKCKSCCGFSLKRTDRLGHEQGHRKVVLAS